MSKIKLPKPNKTENIYGDDYKALSNLDLALIIGGLVIVIGFILLEILIK